MAIGAPLRINEVIAMHAKRGESVAIVDGDQRITYARLDATAASIADALVALGVRERSVVTVVLNRGWEQVAVLLGIMKCRSAYLAIDPSWPNELLKQVVALVGGGLTVVAEDPGILETPTWVFGSQVVTETAPDPSSVVVPEDTACLFMTSGTTGRPKVVTVSHQAITRLAEPGSFGGFEPSTVMPVAAPCQWDAFALEVWAPLLAGGTAVIVDERFISGPWLLDAVSRFGLSHVWLTSSLFNLVVDETPEAFVGLRTVLTGGERLSPRHVQAFLEQHQDVRLVNGYGPVEGTVFATTHEVTLADCTSGSGIPIGVPVPGTAVAVNGRSDGGSASEPGEICISGAGLAHGYLGDEELTAQRFIQLDLGDGPRRAYRTGDLGWIDRSGVLHYIGRADRQLKVAGVRIDLAEVEKQVLALPPVGSCHVVPRRDADGNLVDLVAFVVLRSDDDDVGDVVRAIGRRLVPQHRPAVVHAVSAVPLTPQGKVDEAGLLRELEDGARFCQEPREQPDVIGADGRTMRVVATAFAEILGRDAVPPDQTFFELGGSSLAAARLVARLSRRLERSVRLTDVYTAPTVAGLSVLLERPRPVSGPDGFPTALLVDGRAPLRPMQRVFLAAHLRDPAERTGHCVLTWLLEGPVDLGALERAVAAVHLRHEALRASYGGGIRVAADPTDVPPPEVELLPAEGPSTALAAVRAELFEPLDPTIADVWRVVLVPVSDSTTAALGIVVHHLAFDGWSEHVLANDLAVAYRQARRGMQPSLAPSPGLVEQALSFDAAHQLDRPLVAPVGSAVALDWPLEGDGVREVRSVTGVLAPPIVERLRREAAASGVTLFTRLFLSYINAMQQVVGPQPLQIGVPVARRQDPLLHDVVGCHMDLATIRVPGGKLHAWDAATVSEWVRTAIIHSETTGPRDGADDHHHQLVFAMQDNPEPHLDLDGVRSSFHRTPYRALPRDLHVELWLGSDGTLQIDVSYQGSTPRAGVESLVRAFEAGLGADIDQTGVAG